MLGVSAETAGEQQHWNPVAFGCGTADEHGHCTVRARKKSTHTSNLERATLTNFKTLIKYTGLRYHSTVLLREGG